MKGKACMLVNRDKSYYHMWMIDTPPNAIIDTLLIVIETMKAKDVWYQTLFVSFYDGFVCVSMKWIKVGSMGCLQFQGHIY